MFVAGHSDPEASDRWIMVVTLSDVFFFWSHLSQKLQNLKSLKQTRDRKYLEKKRLFDLTLMVYKEFILAAVMKFSYHSQDSWES